MQDLRKIFRYARPYRRDLFAAVGLIFIECIFAASAAPYRRMPSPHW